MKTRVLFLALIAAMALLASCRAKSALVPVSGATLADKLEWLATNAASNTGYLLEVTAAKEELAPYNLAYFGSDITLHLKGVGNEKAVSFSGSGSLFTISSGVTLILENLTLAGASGNNGALVRINSGGSLQLNQGAKISGNGSNGVRNNGGTFTMNGGEISGNAGGVYNDIVYMSIDREYVTINGTFTMNGGKIADNNVLAPSSGGGVFNNGIFTMAGGEISGNGGGGVHNNGGVFTMNGGKISGNNSPSFDGGGVHNGVIYAMTDGVYGVINGIFTMAGGEISGNTSPYGGGVSNYGNFTMAGGEISGNTSSIGGGVDNHGIFTMKGGKVSGNAVSFYGGGVSNSVTYTYTYEGYVPRVIFTMTGGEISGNAADTSNDEVFVDDGAILDKTGGTITGYID